MLKFTKIPLRDWNTIVRPSAPRVTSWNSPKSLWGIETNAARLTGQIFTMLKFTKIPLRDWNELKAKYTTLLNRWNSPKSLWGIETSPRIKRHWSRVTCWNSPKSLWGIETSLAQFDGVTDLELKFTKIPLRDWNSVFFFLELLSVGASWNSPKSLWGIETDLQS